MRGSGTKAAITSVKMEPVRLLDLTRSMRRAGRIATGIDRVELAYLEHFTELASPVFGLIRTPLGYLLLDRSGMRTLLQKLSGRMTWGKTSVMSRLGRGRSVTEQRAESDARRLAVMKVRRRRLSAALRGICADGFEYYNVGHSNLTERVLVNVKGAGGSINVLIHDVIPLTHPQFQREGSVKSFREKLQRVSRYADRVIYNSADTQKQTEPFLRDFHRVPESVVAHLGVTVTPPQPDLLPHGLPPDAPYFVTIGTIEPRKNHAFLLDLWEEMGADAPMLLVCGNRGWNNLDVFSRLDALRPADRIRECPNLPDAALAALIENATGALFPSYAEGYGLPLVECIALRARVLCNNLPVFYEIIGKNAVYVPVSDRYLWMNKIKELEASPPAAQDHPQFELPRWQAHFNTALRLT